MSFQVLTGGVFHIVDLLGSYTVRDKKMLKHHLNKIRSPWRRIQPLPPNPEPVIFLPAVKSAEDHP